MIKHRTPEQIAEQDRLELVYRKACKMHKAGKLTDDLFDHIEQCFVNLIKAIGLDPIGRMEAIHEELNY